MDAEKFLAHYGVKGMKKGVRNEQDPLGNGDTSGGVSAVKDVPGLLSGSTSSSTSVLEKGKWRNVDNTYQYNRGSLERFTNKMFDHKVNVVRGKNVSSRVKQGQVNKFVDKLFKQVVRKKK